MIEKTRRIIILFDFYQNLLTKKQRSYIESYYEDDLSLSEVAEKYEVSRNAIHDNLKRVIALLEDYEEKLKLHDKFNKKLSIIEKIRNDKQVDIKELLDELEEL